MLELRRDDGKPVGPKMAKAMGLFSSVFPYLLLLAASLLPFAVYFWQGNNITSGDDMIWHRIWVYDLAYGWKNGSFGITPSHLLMGNLGLGTYLFYGSFSHIAVALLHVLIPTISINWSWKILTLLMTFLMGVWAYWLGKEISKDKVLGLMIGVLCILMPYRINCILYRAAYPEAWAISFMPLLFLGVHRVGHADFRPANFLCCVVGVSATVLCHPFTGMISCVGAFVYLLCCYEWMGKLFKDWKAITYTVTSVILIFLLVGWYAVPMYGYLSSGIYNVSDAELMWTNIEHLMGSTSNSGVFSGFLREGWLEHYNFVNNYHESYSSWLHDVFSFTFFGLGGVTISSLLSKKGYSTLGNILGAFFALLTMLFTRRPEVIRAVPFFVALFLFLSFEKEEKKTFDEIGRSATSTIKSPEFYWTIGLAIFSILLCYVPSLWEHMPSLMLNAQFAWRMWSLFFFAICIIVAFLLRPFAKTKWARGSVAVAAVAIFLATMAPIDKRFTNASGQTGVGEPTTSMIKGIKNQGCQNEYVPMCFRDGHYVPEYSNSLYKEVRLEIYGSRSYHWGLEGYITPVFLEGSGSLTITELSSPEAKFDAVIESEEAFVQLPQFYYEGYEMRLYNEESKYTVKGVNVDGLVSFHLLQGTYKAELKWVGTKAYQILFPAAFVGIAGSIALVAVPFVVGLIHKKKKTPEEA